jgi:membrane protein DedA with SNARE-associated domain
MDTLIYLINHYGYLGIFTLLMLGIIGLPVPDETLLTLSGYLIYRGHLHLIPTFFSAYLGSILGISISYAIGSTFGHHILLKYGHYVHITEERLQKVHRWFGKIGRWTLLVGYYVPGVRHIIAIFAGASELELWEFGIFAYTGGLLWTITFLSIGYFFGEKWKIILRLVDKHLTTASIIAVAVIILYFLIKMFIKKLKKS